MLAILSKAALCFLTVFVVGLSAIATQADDNGFALPGFGKHRFYLVQDSQPGGFKTVNDPIDPNNTKKVFKFTIKPEDCMGMDCTQQSVRAAVGQFQQATQPSQAWYGWEMYFVKGFPVGGVQSRGFQIFNEFKDQPICMLSALSLDLSGRDKYLSWMMQKPTGNPAGPYGDDCIPSYKTRVVAVKEIEGGWHRFELFVKWTRENNGKLVLYLDGRKVVNYAGPTCYADCSKMNYYNFGSYMCCTAGSDKILEATVYYRYMSRARTREMLIWQ